MQKLMVWRSNNMTLLQKLKQILINLLGRKITKIPKPTTIDLKTTETIKIPSSDIASKKPLPDIPIKQVEQVSETVTPPSTIIIVRFNDGDGKWHYSNGEKPTSKLPPGNVWDTCGLMAFEDHPEIKKHGLGIMAKLPNERNYVLSPSKNEYRDKKCYSSRIEQIKSKDGSSKPTGQPRNFYKTKLELAKSLGKPIYYVKFPRRFENSNEILRKAIELLMRFPKINRHLHGDNFILAFACITKSTLVTLDHQLAYCSRKSKVKTILFSPLLSAIMGESPMKSIEKERVNYFKKQVRRTILLYGNRSSFTQPRKKQCYL